jgi:hypothetical protein
VLILVMLTSMLSISTLAQTSPPKVPTYNDPAGPGSTGEGADWQVNYHLGTGKVRFLNTKSGAAALVLSANPAYTPAQIQSFLEGRAIDMGSSGKDNEFGHGRLYLGEPIDASSGLYLPLIMKNYPGDTTPPDVPTLISPSNGITTTNTTPTFSWSTSSGATQYHIQIDNNANFSSPERDEKPPTNSYTSSSPLSVDIYNWRVRAGNSSNFWSDWSSAWTVTITDTVSAWTIIEEEDFESDFPGTGWDLGDDSSGAYKWAKRSCRSYEGSHSAWAVGGGFSGSGLSCDSTYPNNVRTWMDYGPFDLSDATAAEMQFKFWANSEPNVDEICWGVATNPPDFNYSCESDTSNSWFDETVDLSDFKGVSYLGEPQVWITFDFFTDGSITLNEGAYVDDVVIRKCTATSCSSSSSSVDNPPDSNLVIMDKPSNRVR